MTLNARALGREPLAADPDTIAMYVVRCADAGFAVSSIRVHLAAICTAHLLAGLSLDLRHPRLAWAMWKRWRTAASGCLCAGPGPAARSGPNPDQPGVALGYLRPTDLWRNNVTERVFRQEGGRKD
jgi:hypothetical protein